MADDKALYEVCGQCGGSGDVADPEDENGLIFDRCRCCGGKGRLAVGVTTGQLRRMVDRERALQGDPGIPVERRLVILKALQVKTAAALARLTHEAVT
jgi:hypothetical protein